MIRKTARPVMTMALLLLTSLSVAAAPAQYDSGIEQARALGTLSLKGELFHVQGLDIDAQHIWVTSVDKANHKGYLHQFDRKTGQFLRRLDVSDGARYHPGGIAIANGSIWVPVAEYRPGSSAVLLEIDTETLTVRRKIEVGDHLGCVAATEQRLVAGNWDSRLFYVFDLGSTAPPQVVKNPSPTAYQDMKFVGDQLVAGGARTPWSGTLDWIDWPSMKITRTLRSGAVGLVRPFGRGGAYTGEGLALEGQDLYLLPEDGPKNGPGRLFHFKLGA
ncbi:MAG: DUF6454 family protein [Polymorphobacter sp.]|uniref:DUF6454 family protein n=1 Tax=Polymorphobacter sp. TaxID=1909290 RepID=UPI003A8934A6